MIFSNYGRNTDIDCKNITFVTNLIPCGPGSVVGIATGYGVDGPGIESRWRRHSPYLSRPRLEPNQSPVQWVPAFFPWVNCGRGVTLTACGAVVMGEKRYTSIAL